MREQIQWQQQPVSHNQACLDLIAAKPHGILRILDDQSGFPQVHPHLLNSTLHFQGYGIINAAVIDVSELKIRLINTNST